MAYTSYRTPNKAPLLRGGGAGLRPACEPLRRETDGHRSLERFFAGLGMTEHGLTLVDPTKTLDTHQSTLGG